MMFDNRAIQQSSLNLWTDCKTSVFYQLVDRKSRLYNEMHVTTFHSLFLSHLLALCVWQVSMQFHLLVWPLKLLVNDISSNRLFSKKKKKKKLLYAANISKAEGKCFSISSKKLLENMIIIAYDSSLKVGLMILWYDIHQVDLGWLKPMSRYKRWMCSAQQIYWTTN